MPSTVITSCMPAPPLFRSAKNVAAGSIDQQAIELALNRGKLGGDSLPQILINSQFLRSHIPHHALCLRHEFVQVLAGAHVEMSEALKECVQILDNGVAKYFGLAVV